MTVSVALVVAYVRAWCGRGGAVRQAVVVLMLTPATEARVPTPVRAPDWVSIRSRGERE
ncbi:hypothetical protein AB0L71_10190 [Streptomyces sp. NPDC052052]|uniref:hypothetical protein n=1 Tax=Streptomyces sp. NPDC052052 TaxID=3154756 RepID=UPI003449C97C